MRSNPAVLVALLWAAAPARAEIPRVQIGAITVEHGYEDGIAGMRVKVAIHSDGLVGRRCLLRFVYEQNGKSFPQQSERIMTVADWIETAFQSRKVLGGTFDMGQPLHVSFTLRDVVQQADLGTAAANAASAPSHTSVLDNITVRELGKKVYRGRIDLGATMARIERGDKFPHRDDGAPFDDHDHRLPRQPPGYWHQYVHPTPGVAGPGPQRLVIGKNGETYYSPDHGKTFRKL